MTFDVDLSRMCYYMYIVIYNVYTTAVDFKQNVICGWSSDYQL